MKTILTAFLTLALLGGCKTYEVKSLQYLTDVETVQLIERDDVVTDIDLKDLREYLLQATWTSKRLITKGAHHLRVNEGSDIYISYYGAFFWVEDRPGYFCVIPEDREMFSQYFATLREEKVFPWRHIKNSEQIK